MLRSYLLFLALFAFASQGWSQVTGVIKEAAGEQPVQGATVFINRTLVSSSTDENGAFLLEGLLPGFMELVIYKSGYQMFRSPIRLQEGKVFKLNLKLTKNETTSTSNAPAPTALSEFISQVIGTSLAASQSKLVNPKALVFSESKVGLSEPLVFENQFNGYRSTCYLSGVEVVTDEFLKKAAIRFDTLIPKNEKQLEEFKAGRQKQYLGSREHLYWSLVNHRSIEQGFEIVDENGKGIPVDSLAKPSKLATYTKLRFPAKMEVRYRGVRDEDFIPSTAFSSADAFDVNPVGVSFNDGPIQMEGSMKVELAEQLPANYFPAEMLLGLDRARETFRAFQEKIFVHTDKPYYYAGQAMWFKAYVNTYQRNLQDSLSRVMYVELITPDRNILLSRTLKIEGGEAYGDWVLPDTLKRGNYYLRAYTSLMRNFGDDNLFVVPIPVLTILDRAVAGPSSRTLSDNLVVTADKTKYKPHEKITVKVKLRDAWAAPGHFSVSVMDADQVVAVPTSSIVNDFAFDEEGHHFFPVSLKYPVENGITISGQFYNDKGKKAKSSVTILQGKFEDVNTIDTDDEGRFALGGLEFNDTVQFRIQAMNTKRKIVGKIELSKRQIPEMDFPDAGEVNFEKTNEVQRVISDYEVPMSARQLDEVTIKASRIVVSEFVSKRYGGQPRVISGEKLFGPNMLGALISTVPGLKVIYIPNAQPGQPSQTLSFLHSNIKNKNTGMEPLIYVDEVFRGGGSNVLNQVPPGAVEALSTINPSNVDHIEVLSTNNGMIMVEQGYGLIAIFMKPGHGYGKTMDVFTINGYNKPRAFTSPDYEKDPDSKLKDARATLYWNPLLTVGEKPEGEIFSFFAADEPAVYKIVVQGVTGEGKAVYAEGTVEVK